MTDQEFDDLKRRVEDLERNQKDHGWDPPPPLPPPPPPEQEVA